MKTEQNDMVNEKQESKQSQGTQCYSFCTNCHLIYVNGLENSNTLGTVTTISGILVVPEGLSSFIPNFWIERFALCL